MIGTKELSKSIGRHGWFSANGMQFGIVIQDLRVSYGNIHYLVTPVEGKGSSWIDARSFAPLDREVTHA